MDLQAAVVKEVKATVPGLVQDEVANPLNAIMPTLVQSLKCYLEGGQQGPFNMPSFVASNSNNNRAPTMVFPDANLSRENTTAAANNEVARGVSPATAHHSSPSIISSTPVRGPTPLPELEALTVQNPASLNKLCIYNSRSCTLSLHLTCMFSQADQVTCTLLLRVENELRDVAKATIIAPLVRVMHNLPMAPDVMRVHIDRVLPDCKDFYPPSQPAGADSELTIDGCLGYPMAWPKALIRLDRPITTPPVIQSLPTVQRVEPTSAQAEDDDDGHDMVMDTDHSADEGHHDHDLQAPLCSKRLFSSQGTPEPAPFFTEDQEAAKKPFSQETLLRAAMPEIQKVSIPPTAAEKPKKMRKRKPKGMAEPFRAKDNIRIPNWHEIHECGKPILPPKVYRLLTPDMKSLHDMVEEVEDTLLSSTSPGYPVFPVKVPANIGFADEYPADVFFVRFDDVFDMFHMKRLPACFVRLLAIRMQYQLMREDTKVIAIMDPYHLQEGHVNHSEGRKKAVRYVQKFFMDHKDKKAILMPYLAE